MIPLSDEGGRRHRFPIVTILLIVANACVFLYQVTLPDRALQSFVLAYGVVPAEITSGQDLPPGIPYPVEVTLITSMFMHGGWLHIIGNMLYLWVFGDNIEDALHSIPFLLFYVATGLAAAFAQIFSEPSSTIPSIGASGAVAGVLGGYLLLHPSNRVNSLLILGIFTRVIQLPAYVVLGFWFVMQLFTGIASIGAEGVGVAYWAHVGGFVAGFFLMIPAKIAGAGRYQRNRYGDRF